MRSLRKLALCCALLASAAAPGVRAATLDNASTFSGLVWAFSTGHAGFSGCGTLFVDATGAVGHSDNYSIYGQLQCPTLGGTYATSGNAYFDSAGSFNMTVSLSVTHHMVCANLSASTLSGSCPIYDSLGNQTGTAFISLL